VPRSSPTKMKRYPTKKKQSSNTGLVVGGLTVFVLVLIGASLFFAAPGPGVDESSSAVLPDEPKTQAPAVVPTKSTKPVSAPDSAPATPTKDPYAELQNELSEPASTAPSTAPSTASPVEGGERGERIEVTRVVDGDTVYLSDGRKVRLIGINTPERDRPLYAEATAALRKLVEEADVLSLQLGKERTDKYGRTLGYLYSGDTLLNGEIVRQGFAYTYTWRPNVAKEAELRELQREARAAKLGLWGLEAPEPADRYVAKRSSHHFHREGCRRIKRLKDRQRVEWGSREAPLDEGYNPCEDCGS
jgi:micrococcal nuclease